MQETWQRNGKEKLGKEDTRERIVSEVEFHINGKAG